MGGERGTSSQPTQLSKADDPQRCSPGALVTANLTLSTCAVDLHPREKRVPGVPWACLLFFWGGGGGGGRRGVTHVESHASAVSLLESGE